MPIRHTIPRSRRGRTLSAQKLPRGRGLCRPATQQMFGPFGGDPRQSEVGRNVPTQFPVSLCLRSGPHVAHRTERHPGRADHKESSDPKSKRLRPASAGELSCPGSECPLAATAPVHSCTVPRRHGRITHRQEDVPWGRCVFVFVFFFCFEPAASWQRCIDYNSTSAGLSERGRTPAAQVSGGQILPSAKQGKTSTTEASSHQHQVSQHGPAVLSSTVARVNDVIEGKRALTAQKAGVKRKGDHAWDPRRAD